MVQVGPCYRAITSHLNTVLGDRTMTIDIMDSVGYSLESSDEYKKKNGSSPAGMA